MTPGHAQPSPRRSLSDTEEIAERFIRDGYVIIRGAIDGDRIRHLTHQSLALRDPQPLYRDGTGPYQRPIEEVDLLNPATWDRLSLYIQTRRELMIADFAPRLWSVLVALAGGEDLLARRTMGEQLILNGEFTTGPAPPMNADYWSFYNWHIDVPAAESKLTGRTDGLVLLTLWSDVAPGGGGPLFSAKSLDHVVRQLEAGAVDTRSQEWGQQIALACDDAQEFFGAAGDVLITHPFMLHSAQQNYSSAVRVLENPTITVKQALNYSQHNRSPTPIERCVIRRLHADSIDRAELLRERARRLIAEQPDYFLPASTREEGARAARQLRELDRWLFCAWVREAADAIQASHATWWARVDAVAQLGRRTLVNDSEIGTSLADLPSDVHFTSSSWSKLVRGLVTPATHNYILAAILRALAPEDLELLETNDSPGHLMVRVVTPDGWAFLDSSAPEPVFVVHEIAGQRLRGAAYHPGDKQAPGGAWIPLAELTLARRSLVELPQAPRVPFSDAPMAWRESTQTPVTAALGVWDRFLQARLQQLFGDPGAARSEYARIATELKRRGLTATLAAQLAERCRGGP